MEVQTEGELKRGLKNRHIQLIALGGAIGTGLFLGIAQTIKIAGPAVLLGYALGGLIAFLIMRQLGEMVAEEPVSGSFSHFAYKYWGDFPGFLSGWNYWVLYVLVGMAELSAVGIYVQYWWPELPTWVSALVFFVVINAINLTNVKFFGEMEFWFAIIKVVAIVGMILFGGWLLLSGQGGEQAKVSNLWALGGFMPNGWHGVIMSLAIIMFSFGGLELVGITAAEADNPRKSIPQAVNQVIYRILIFYIGALAVLLSLFPWSQLAEGGSPFVMIFSALGESGTANILNIVVLTAALSVYNSGVYCNSRMLHGLAQQGNAPRILGKVDKRGVPVPAIMLSALVTLLCVVINYLLPGKAFGILMSLVVAALVINWGMISLAHLKFRAAKDHEGVTPVFKAFWSPFTNYLCLAFMALLLVLLYISGETIAVELVPVWLVLNWLGYRYKCRTLGDSSGDSVVINQ
ncbi:MAG: amino acid permease [Tolumonas sp.]|nr:amino acid permease [Tolumonas sp.]